MSKRPHWRWHEVAAYVYFLICLVDFAVMPVMAFVFNRTPWQPVTIAGLGIFHLAFAGFCGVGTWAYHKRIALTAGNPPSP